jgi:hypothetical protein
VGIILDQPVANRAAAYDLLQAYLPAVKLSSGNSRDFLYQINRPVQSTVLARCSLNRLNKWMALQIQFLVGNVAAKDLARKELTVVRLELDVNSDLEAAVPISRDLVLPALNEMATRAFQIASEGDQP